MCSQVCKIPPQLLEIQVPFKIKQINGNSMDTFCILKGWLSVSIKLGLSALNAICIFVGLSPNVKAIFEMIWHKTQILWSKRSKILRVEGWGLWDTWKRYASFYFEDASNNSNWMVMESGMDMYAPLHWKWITSKDSLYSTCNSAQCYVAAWMGWELGGEWIHVHVWLRPLSVHLKLSQHC